MNHEQVQLVRQKLGTLGEELVRLEAKRDAIVERRGKATTPEERHMCAREAGAVFPEISRVRGRIGHARRLLAHSQGDEYQAGGA